MSKEILKITVSDGDKDLMVQFIQKGNNYVNEIDGYGGLFFGYGTIEEIKNYIQQQKENYHGNTKRSG